jgi:hypothetical protein
VRFLIYFFIKDLCVRAGSLVRIAVGDGVAENKA